MLGGSIGYGVGFPYMLTPASLFFILQDWGLMGLDVFLARISRITRFWFFGGAGGQAFLSVVIAPGGFQRTEDGGRSRGQRTDDRGRRTRRKEEKALRSLCLCGQDGVRLPTIFRRER